MTATLIESGVDDLIIEEVKEDTPEMCDAQVLNANDEYDDCPNEANYYLYAKCCGAGPVYICEDCLIIAGQERANRSHKCDFCRKEHVGFMFSVTPLSK